MLLFKATWYLKLSVTFYEAKLKIWALRSLWKVSSKEKGSNVHKHALFQFEAGIICVTLYILRNFSTLSSTVQNLLYLLVSLSKSVMQAYVNLSLWSRTSKADPPGCQTHLVQRVWALGSPGSTHSASEPSPPWSALCPLPSPSSMGLYICMISLCVFNLWYLIQHMKLFNKYSCFYEYTSIFLLYGFEES